jgi:hypothetical protein
MMTNEQITAYLESLALCDARHLRAGDRINAGDAGFRTVVSVAKGPAGTVEIALEGAASVPCLSGSHPRSA